MNGRAAVVRRQVGVITQQALGLEAGTLEESVDHHAAEVRLACYPAASAQQSHHENDGTTDTVTHNHEGGADTTSGGSGSDEGWVGVLQPKRRQMRYGAPDFSCMVIY